MERKNKTLTLSEILNSSVFGDNSEGRMKSVIKYSTIFSFWDEIAGKKFASLTRPYAIKYSKIYISAKSPVVIQELTLNKKKLLEKINIYSRPLGINIKDIHFDYKNYFEDISRKNDFVEDKPKEINNNELQNITMEKDFENQITKSVEKISFLDKKAKEALIGKILQNKRAIIYRENK